MKPLENPASAPQPLINKSAAPWARIRSSVEIESTSRLDPPMSPKLQPTPSSHKAGNNNVGDSPDNADNAVAEMVNMAPTVIVA